MWETWLTQGAGTREEMKEGYCKQINVFDKRDAARL